MIAYNTTWLANLQVQDKVKKYADKGAIPNAEYHAVAVSYPVGFYTPNLFVRCGLVLLTIAIVSFGDGFLGLASDFKVDFDLWFTILGLLTYVALELMVRLKSHYRSGVDDALLFVAGLQLCVGVCGIFTKGAIHNIFFLMASAIVTIICALLTLRFIDRLAAAVAAISLFTFVFYLWLQIVPGGLSTAPFGMMFFSGGLYWLSSKLLRKEYTINYHDCLQIVQMVALLALYGSGNYYVVQNLGAELGGRKGPVAFGAIFWIWTFAVPVAYLVLGLRRKDSMLLRIGLLLLVVAGFTVRAYYYVMPIEILLTLAGAGILIAVYVLSEYLKTPKHGITVAEPDEMRQIDNLRIESLAAAASFAHPPEAPANDSFKYGRGSFGGGGSSSEY